MENKCHISDLVQASHYEFALAYIYFVMFYFSPLEIRRINDQLSLFERSFLDPQGLPGRPYAR